GESAKHVFHSNPENTVFDAKCLIGRKYDDLEVQWDQKHWPFQLISKGAKPSIQVKHRGNLRYFTPEEVSTIVLVKMK
ncbi:heat shock protein 70 family, partial [Gautieria morchelliformis]